MKNKCPICNAIKANNILNLKCGNLDGSSLYPTVKITVCNNCGHIFNFLSDTEVEGLTSYYNNEYAPLNLSTSGGDRPGSDSEFSNDRYRNLLSVIAPVTPSVALKVLDVGCATGGFLQYLHKRGFNLLYGIEPSTAYVKNAHGNVKQGCAESIPFEDNSFDLLVLDQVMEHLVDPVKAIREAKRVLVDGGLLCIGIPDAARYGECYFFDFYFFLMREHIQHFDLDHLQLLVEREGFEIVSSSRTEQPMMSDTMVLPNLNVAFRLTNEPSEVAITRFKLKEKMERYIATEYERLAKKKYAISGLAKRSTPVYVWGIGREFLYLYESAGLAKCNIVGMIDTNPYKQKTFTVDGMGIWDKTILEEATPNSVLIIAATAHTKEIEASLLKMDYGGQLIRL